MTRGRTLDKIFAIIAGIAIWAYVIGAKDPVTTGTIKLVPVQLVNAEVMQNAGLAIAGSGEYTVDVVVGGTRSVVNSTKPEDLVATADVSGLHVGQNYITVEVEAPSYLTVNEIRTQKIQVYVDHAVAVEKDLKIFTANLADGKELGAIEVQTSDFTVSGAESLVNNVVAVQATIDAKDRSLDQPVTEDVSLVPIDVDGNRVVGVKLSQDTLKIKSTLYDTKEVALNIPVEGELPEDVKLRSEIIPASVVIKGPSEMLANIWQIDAAPINKNEVTESCSIPLELALPEGVEAAHDYRNLTVDYEVVGMEEKALSFSDGDVEFTNVPEGMTASLVNGFDLSFSVYTEDIEKLTKDNVAIEINLKGLSAGEHDVYISDVKVLGIENAKLKVDLSSFLVKVNIM